MWLKKKDNGESFKPLLLFLNTEGTAKWGHVCLPKQLDNKTMQLIADTVCRQLGYTNSLRIIDDTKYATSYMLQYNCYIAMYSIIVVKLMQYYVAIIIIISTTCIILKLQVI